MEIKICYCEKKQFEITKCILISGFCFCQIPLQTFPSINLLKIQSSLTALSTLKNASIKTKLYTYRLKEML